MKTKISLLLMSSILLVLSFVYSFRENVIKNTGKGVNHYKIVGIDVSHHQGDIDWKMVKRDTVHFCFMKATEGTNFKDKRFKYNLTQAKKNKIAVGAYHYYRYNKNNILQFKNFISVVPKNSIDFPPVIDAEYLGNPGLGDKKNREKFVKDLKEFQKMIRNYYGEEPIIYTDILFYNNVLKNDIKNNLWMNDLHAKSINYLDSSQWIFWQHSHKGNKNGIKGYVDLNVFNGTLEDFNRLKFSEAR